MWIIVIYTIITSDSEHQYLRRQCAGGGAGKKIGHTTHFPSVIKTCGSQILLRRQQWSHRNTKCWAMWRETNRDLKAKGKISIQDEHIAENAKTHLARGVLVRNKSKHLCDVICEGDFLSPLGEGKIFVMNVHTTHFLHTTAIVFISGKSQFAKCKYPFGQPWFNLPWKCSPLHNSRTRAEKLAAIATLVWNPANIHPIVLISCCIA